jgi:predicted nucleic acid-binding protein
MAAKKKRGAHLFIDTNVLLGFYSYSNDDLKELEKLVNILKTNVVKLYITQQVVDEFYRNRDSKLSESFDVFRPFGNISCPSFMTSLPEHKAFAKALKNYKEARKALADKARSQADARELLADQLFARIVEQASVIRIDDTAYDAADRRARLGNPPGKSSNTIGDELNWELLLAHVPKGSDLHIITKDGDYSSKLNPGQPKVFLADEWKKRKAGCLLLHEQISLFFKANYPDEDFSLDIEKKESIDALIGSPNFASTHAAIALLDPYIDFLSEEEAEEVVQGALSNSQVAWIASDSDVEAFLTKMLNAHGDAISPTLKKRLEEALGIDNEDDKEPDQNAAEGEELDVPF